MSEKIQKQILFSETQMAIIKNAMENMGESVFVSFVRNAALEKAVKINKEK